MKRTIVAVAVGLSALLGLTACGTAAPATPAPATSGAAATPTSTAARTYRIGINQFVSHASLDAARDGFKAALADAGLQVDYDEQNAQTDQATATSIAATFAGADLDLVLAIATPSALASAQSITDTPVLFTAVTDPLAAKLVDSMEAPGGNVSGTSDMNPVAEQIALIKRIAPDAKTVGVIYSSGEINSEVQVAAAREAAAAEGLELVERTVTVTGDVQQAASGLDVDAFYIPTDNNVVAGLDAVIQVAEEKKIPIVAGEGNSVAKGAIVTYGIDYTELGRQTGEMAVRVLTQGADVATMPVETQKELTLVINKAAAERMGVTLPADLIADATAVG